MMKKTTANPPRPRIHSRASRVQQLSEIVNPKKNRYSSVPHRTQVQKEERSFDQFVKLKLAQAQNNFGDPHDAFRAAYKNLAINNMIQSDVFSQSFQDEDVTRKFRETSGMNSSMIGSSNKSLMWKMIVPITEQRNQVFQRRVQTEITTSFDKSICKKGVYRKQDGSQSYYLNTFETNDDQDTLETTNLSFVQQSKDLDIVADTLQSIQPLFFNEHKRYEEKLHLLQDIYNRKYQKENKDPRRVLTTTSTDYNDTFQNILDGEGLDSSVEQVKVESESRPASNVRQQRNGFDKDAQAIFRRLQSNMRNYASGKTRNKTAESHRSTSQKKRLTEISFDFQKKPRDSLRTENDDVKENYNFIHGTNEKYNHALIIPSWLKNRKDFKEGHKTYMDNRSQQILDICKKIALKRRSEEILEVENWLRKVKFVAQFNDHFFKDVAGKVTSKQYKKGEYLCKIGDNADRLYFVYDGLVKCEIDGQVLAKYKPFDAPGQDVLYGTRFRTSDLIAMTQTNVLELTVASIQSFIDNFAMEEKHNNIKFIRSVPRFIEMNEDILRGIANRVHVKLYIAGETIYEEGDVSEKFYIIKRGSFKFENTLSIEKQNMWPDEKEMRTWKKSTIERKVKYGDLLNKNECFGHIEVIRNCRRLNTVICVEDAELLTLNKAEFFDCFGIKEINLLTSYLKEKTGERPDLKNKLIQLEENKRRMRDLIVNKTWTPYLGSLNKKELKKINKNVVQPVVKRFEDDLRNFILSNTYKVEKDIKIAEFNHI